MRTSIIIHLLELLLEYPAGTENNKPMIVRRVQRFFYVEAQRIRKLVPFQLILPNNVQVKLMLE